MIKGIRNFRCRLFGHKHRSTMWRFWDDGGVSPYTGPLPPPHPRCTRCGYLNKGLLTPLPPQPRPVDRPGQLFCPQGHKVSAVVNRCECE